MKLTTKQIMLILMSTLLVLAVVMSCIVFSRVGSLLRVSAGTEPDNTPSTSSVPSSSSIPVASSSVAPPETFADHEHEYIKVKTYSATCDTEGYTLYECSCGRTDIQDFSEPLGHKYGTAKVVAATCTEDGWTERTCSRCKLVEKTNPTKAGHTFGAWKEATVASGAAINEQRTCSTCKLTEIKSVNSSDSWLIHKTTLDPQDEYTRYQIVLNPDDSDKGTSYEIYVGLTDKTLEFAYSGSKLSISYTVNGIPSNYAVPTGTKIITIYSDGRATPAKPVAEPLPDVPASSVPETTGPAVPETTGPAAPETTGPATPETTGPDVPASQPTSQPTSQPASGPADEQNS